MARIGTFKKKIDRNVSEVGDHGTVSKWRNEDGVVVTVTKACDFTETVPDGIGKYKKVHNLEYWLGVSGDDSPGAAGPELTVPGCDGVHGSKSSAKKDAAEMMRLITDEELVVADLEV